jgi:hypothetical protein
LFIFKVTEPSSGNGVIHRGRKPGAAAPVTGAAADEYNLNVVDCNASVTVPRLPSQCVLSV